MYDKNSPVYKESWIVYSSAYIGNEASLVVYTNYGADNLTLKGAEAHRAHTRIMLVPKHEREAFLPVLVKELRDQVVQV